MFQNHLFSQKIVLVTGGGSGIGLEIARQFLQHGAAEVYICSRKKERLEAAQIELHKFGKARSFALDIREPEQIAHLADLIENQSGRLDILVNNAGGQYPNPAEMLSPNGWKAVVNTNLNGTWFVTQEMAKRFFLPQNDGAVVNIVLNNFRGTPGMAHSAAARAGVMNLTKTLAVEWATRGVRLNSVAPGIIKSSGLENYPPSLLQGIEKSIPMQRLGSTEEVAWLVLFLASKMAAYLTGETIYIDGGARLWGDIWKME
jgi:citronellol/citronellal dehydrogenase